MKIVVFGGSGFVGRAIAEALKARAVETTPLRAPRIRVSLDGYADYIESDSTEFRTLLDQCRGADVVINAAGVPQADASFTSELLSANSALPGLIGRAARAAGVRRYVHVSSAAVQGRVPCLTADVAERGFSAYSWSKVLGERMALQFGPHATTVHRPAGVHAAERHMTQQIARFAASRLSTVGGDGRHPTPQSLVGNVGDAVAFLAVANDAPPRITTQPWEGLTTSGLLELLGGHAPHRLPMAVANTIVNSMIVGAGPIRWLRPYARRIELLLLGQAQEVGWLSTQGWRPPHGIDTWRDIGTNLRTQLPASNELPKRCRWHGSASRSLRDIFLHH